MEVQIENLAPCGIATPKAVTAHAQGPGGAVLAPIPFQGYDSAASRPVPFCGATGEIGEDDSENGGRGEVDFDNGGRLCGSDTALDVSWPGGGASSKMGTAEGSPKMGAVGLDLQLGGIDLGTPEGKGPGSGIWTDGSTTMKEEEEHGVSRSDGSTPITDGMPPPSDSFVEGTDTSLSTTAASDSAGVLIFDHTHVTDCDRSPTGTATDHNLM